MPPLLEPAAFPYDRYLAVKAQREAWMAAWAQGQYPSEVPVVIQPLWDMWNDNTCADRDRFLQANLWGMAASADWTSDDVFPHIEPWYGVGLYASGFGARYWWDSNSAPQTRPLYTHAEEVAHIRTPHPGASEPMREVLERIRYYRQVTHDQLPICLTDTQSPNDTASLLMEVNEFFSISVFEPERLERFMLAVTDLIIAFSEMQMRAIGPVLSQPGHMMVCCPGWRGISVSDDNMALLSHQAYEVAALPYNSRIAAHFGGLALHSCGQIRQNIPVQLRTPHLTQVETAACITAKDSDPSPNSPEAVRDGYRGSGVLAKIRIHKSEVDMLERLLAPDFKCVVTVTGVETRAESELVYQAFKTRIAQITTRWV